MVVAHRRSRAFSLIELVIVVVIIGIIGAIAIPRMSRGAEGAGDAALKGNLAVLRSAIDLYSTEHGGTYPTTANLANALTQYSNETGTTIQATKDGATGVIFGPYLRAVPPLPVGANRGLTAIHDGVIGAATFGWHYTPATGVVRANCAAGEQDARNVAYNTY